MCIINTNTENIIHEGNMILEKLEDIFFDINRVPGNGLLIFPLSMNRLFLGQDPKTLYDFLCFFEPKIQEKTVDIVFIYTNGLYFNNGGISSCLRKKTTAQMITHKRELYNLIKKNSAFSPRTIHFIPWDYLLLQADNYLDIHASLFKRIETDRYFKQLIDLEIKQNLDKNLESYSFILEETIITYLIRNKLVQLPTVLSDQNGWHLIFYHGRCLIPDVYLYQKNILPQNKSIQHMGWFNNLASAAMYNMKRKILVDYNKINIDSLNVQNNKKAINNTELDHSIS